MREANWTRDREQGDLLPVAGETAGPMIVRRPIVCDSIECVLAQNYAPARIIRVTGYAHSLYVHMELSQPIDLSDRRVYDAVKHACGYAPEWAEGESWLGFRHAPGLFPLNVKSDWYYLGLGLAAKPDGAL